MKILIFLLLAFPTLGQVKIYKENGIWKYDETIIIKGAVLTDTSAIPDPPTTAVIQQPYKVVNIPGKLEAEDYDKGGEGIAFHDSDNTNQGGKYRTDGVDIEATGPVFNVGYNQDGEWYEYTVNVSAGIYKIDCRVASIINNSSFNVQVDGATIGTVIVPNTGAWQTYQTQSFTATLTTGKKVIRVNVTRGQFNLDWIQFSIATTTPPTGTIINVLPGQSIKSKTETASQNTTVVIAEGTYNENIVNVPVGVSIAGAGTGKTIINATGTYPGDDAAVFQLKSDNRVEGNQTIGGFTINGNNRSETGVIVSNRNNVNVNNYTARDCTFSGLQVKSSDNSSINIIDLFNCSWASSGWSSGELCIGDVKNFTATDVKLGSNSPNRGYAVKVLPRFSAININFSKFDIAMHKSSIWNNGQSMNIGIELADAYYDGIEISDCVTKNQWSFASGQPTKSGKLYVHNNVFNLGGGTYALEMICSDAEISYNQIYGGMMFLANFKPNMKARNWNVHHNVFTDPAGASSWTGVFLFGANGVENVNINNNELTVRGHPITMPKPPLPGVTIEPNNIIKN